ncbi:MAG: hypothetical protein KKD38_06550, partial [Candidatus Delongbacteria bacterium]|nr:hypothetical protein [Candidatus Delongbacteria bacterium]MCG2760246.1 hypothetical protein [Candidatus Delongbacteria bacterium]
LRDDNDINETDGLIKKKGNILIPEIEDKSYPIVILLNENNEIIFASKGYNMNIGDLLLKKVKKN